MLPSEKLSQVVRNNGGPFGRTSSSGSEMPVAKLSGEQGTINVPFWSPDSTHFAFVSYALVP